MCLKTLYWLQFEYLFKICFFFRFSRHFSIILTTFFNKIRKNIWHISKLHKHLKIFVDRHHWSLPLYFIALGHGRWVSRLKWCRKKKIRPKMIKKQELKLVVHRLLLKADHIQYEICYKISTHPIINYAGSTGRSVSVHIL